MIKISKRKKYIILIIIFFIIFLLSTYFILSSIKFQKTQKKLGLVHFKFNINNPINNMKLASIEKAPDTNAKIYKSYNWRIIIPKINLDAPILEGTDSDILRKGVGHFENSGKTNRKYMPCCS